MQHETPVSSIGNVYDALTHCAVVILRGVGRGLGVLTGELVFRKWDGAYSDNVGVGILRELTDVSAVFKRILMLSFCMIKHLKHKVCEGGRCHLGLAS